MGFLENLLNKRKIKSVMKITDQETLTKIALTENKNMEIVSQAISQITDQERLFLIACVRMNKSGDYAPSVLSERFGESCTYVSENLDVAGRAIQSIDDYAILKKLAQRIHPRLQDYISDKLSDYPDECATNAIDMACRHGTSGRCAFASKVTRPDLVRKIFCIASDGDVVKIAADKMSNEELMDVLLTDAKYLASRNISSGKYEACNISRYILDRLSAQDITRLAQSAASEKMRKLAQAVENKF